MRSRLVASLLLLSIAGRAAAQAAAAPAGPTIPATPAPAGETPTAVPPVALALVAPDLRPRIFVKDLDHLAELVKDDPAIASQARSLSTRRTTALAVGGAVTVAGLAVFVTGVGRQSCHDETTPFPLSGSFQVCEADPTQAIVGMGITLAGGLLGILLMPGNSDFLDVINAWNVSHPERPFEITGGHHPTLDQVAVPGAR